MGCRLRIFLTNEEKVTLSELRKASLVAQRIKDRAFVLLLNARGWKNDQIAEILNWGEKTVRQTIHRYYSWQEMKGDLVGLGRYVLAGVQKASVPLSLAQQVRQYVYAYAAVAPSLGQMTCLILPYVNTQMMNLFLQQVSVEFADYFIILQVDKAAWHRSNSLKVPENIRLVYQPSYSPQLMPVEHLWDEIREKHFYNRIFKSLSQVEDELNLGLVELLAEPERLRSLTFFPHLRMPV